MRLNKLSWLLSLLVVAVACSNAEKKAEERQRLLDEARAQRKADQEAKEKSTGAVAAPVQLDAQWGDPAFVRINNEKKCPDNLWAPKASAFNPDMKSATFFTVLAPPEGVKLGEYNAGKGFFPLEVAGIIDCEDSAGRVAIAFNEPTPYTPGNSAAQPDSEVAMRVWQAPMYQFELPMKSMNDAKEFEKKNRFGLKARIVFKLGSSRIDRKIVKTAKQSGGGIEVAGGANDWGAGRCIKAQVVGIRVSTEQEKTSILEKKP
jgi:hypothetical protein